MTEMREKISSKVSQLEEAYLLALEKILNIPSVKGMPTLEAPFGIEPKRAIEAVLTLARELGFETAMVNNAMGYAEFGEGDDYIGVVGHLDVVEAGSNWTYPPYDLTIVDGIGYGRGILDNKGPALATLFALYALKELEIPLTKKIRLIFGSDEESGSADIPLYLAKEKPPVIGFTPDCKYPAVYGERGILGLELRTSFALEELSLLSSFEGEFTPSSVPDTARITWIDGSQTEATGKRAPSNAPELGLNAITLLAQTVAELEMLPSGSVKTYFTWLATSFHDQHAGEGLGINFSDEDSGSLQLTPYQLVLDREHLILSLSIRYPITVTENQIITELEKVLPSDSQLTVTRSLPATIFPKEHSMLAVMKEVYEYCTGLDGTPVTTTGATYARKMPNIIAFGPSFPGQKGIAHNADEYMAISDLMKNMEIYALTLAELAR